MEEERKNSKGATKRWQIRWRRRRGEAGIGSGHESRKRESGNKGVRG